MLLGMLTPIEDVPTISATYSLHKRELDGTSRYLSYIGLLDMTESGNYSCPIV